MIGCPRCGLEVDRLHPLPPEIITREVITAVGTGEEETGPVACQDCINDLMGR